MKKFLGFNAISKGCLFFVFAFLILYGCTKDDDKKSTEINDSLTLFKLDNKNNNLDLTSTDTVASMSGVNGKYIPVSGAAGATNGLDTMKLELYTMGDSLLNSITLTSFYKPDYHVINAQLTIPASQRGQVYKVLVKAVDKAGTVIGTKGFYGMDVVSCDPLPPCVVANQITVLVETPAGTPETDDIILFGSLNGWNRGDATYKLNKNLGVPNCYCVSIPFPPGYSGWQVGEVFVSRQGSYAKDAVTNDGSAFTVNYSTTDLGPLWKIKVAKWRDQ